MKNLLTRIRIFFKGLKALDEKYDIIVQALTRLSLGKYGKWGEYHISDVGRYSPSLFRICHGYGYYYITERGLLKLCRRIEHPEDILAYIYRDIHADYLKKKKIDDLARALSTSLEG